ncbi:CdaR family transcriptional regulator [Corynebacterium sp. LK2510]|uniref:CdaR family transcriptional regulator n=1 Tax=Corynebacterium sp. LK2510 TaxID=3110472 RepID=UPI0034CFA83C
MHIGPDHAQRIVAEISTVLGMGVNLINREATIIASTDSTRVGDYHLGAAHVIADGLDCLAIPADNPLPGTRPGLNLPIRVNGTTAGVLGVTGDPEAITTPAHVLQKMTEILLRETHMREEAERHERTLAHFLHSWLYDHPERLPELAEAGRFFGVDITAPHIVVAASISPAHERFQMAPVDTHKELDLAASRLVTALTSSGAVAATLGSRLIAAIPLTPPHTGEETLTKVADIVRSQARRTRRTSTVRIAAGISGHQVEPTEAASQAEKALHHAQSSHTDVHLYDELCLELLVSAIPPHDREEFVRRVFRDIPASSREEAMRDVRAYLAADGSLAEAAHQLFIHKNTLNARLNRFAELTGFDLRSMSDAAVVWLAIQMHDTA